VLERLEFEEEKKEPTGLATVTDPMVTVGDALKRSLLATISASTLALWASFVSNMAEIRRVMVNLWGFRSEEPPFYIHGEFQTQGETCGADAFIDCFAASFRPSARMQCR
jgi:hypothetical protein